MAIGWGVHGTVANECKALGIKKALITTTALKGTGIVDEIERLLSDLNIRTGNLNEQFCLQEKELEHIIRWQYANDFDREGNPRSYKFEDCIKLLEDML